MRIIVIGGGIGGLSVALACARDGHEVVVVEKAGNFGEVGAGIQISPNGARVLEWLDLLDEHLAVAVRPERVVIRRWHDDAILGVTALGDEVVRRHGLAYTNVYRPDLIDVLLRGIERQQFERPDSVTLVNGSEPLAFDDASTHVEVRLSSGDVLSADVLIGADGIHSTTRRHLVTTGSLASAPSRFSGYVAYRALVPRDRVEHLPVEVTNRLGPDRHVVSYFVGSDRRFLNLVAFVPETSWTVESWTEPGRLADLLASYEGWSPELSQVLAAVEPPVFRWAMHDREPLPTWGTGRITLLGDSCHPMLPFLAQGGCQALEDSAVLTRCLRDVDAENPRDVRAALARYENVRRPRTDTIQGRSWKNATVFHLPDGPRQEQRDADLGRRSAIESLVANDWLYGYDALTADLHPPAD